jgi:putative pyruvate formate lyase activating enzyme
MGSVGRYVTAKDDGVLEERIGQLEGLLGACTLCPRRCMVNRLVGEAGFCGALYDLTVSSAFPHFGEESVLVGTHGSGTIFLAHCNLKCVFCQNKDNSIGGEGQACSTDSVAAIMVELQRRGCHNINFVTPTHYVPQLLRAVSKAVSLGLNVPLVYNTSGYDSMDVIRLLDGIIDIYMPDIKFLDGATAQRYCRARDYPEVVMEVLREMHRQVGDLVIDGTGLATGGLLVRHLVMPSHGADSQRILRFLHDEISENVFVNIMGQYHPCHRAGEFPEISVRPSKKEYLDVLLYARSMGLTRALTH